MDIRKFIVFVVLSLSCGLTYAHDFVVTLDGQKVYFNIVSSKNKTVEITYNGSIANAVPTYFEGELTVPPKVKHNDVVYSVVRIGKKAFSGADKLTGVILPEGLTEIGDFAFEGCTSLSRIIFPGNRVKFGEGVFFKCDKIQDLSFGSDWKELELKMFRWSDSLVSIVVPVKVEKIRNMKSLKHLRNISVDMNNSRFSSVDGILYNKDKETLYGCPRAYSGPVKVYEGTKYITSGAFIDCEDITGVDLPASLTQMSFNEFSRMRNLRKLIFRGEKPIMTAEDEKGTDVFLLQVHKGVKIKISVPKESMKLYRKSFVQKSGEYSIIGETTPYFIDIDTMPKKNSIVGIKNILKIGL